MNNFAQSLRAQAAEQAREWDVPSLSICVVQDGKTLLCDGIGMRDNASRPADAQTLYQIASCTKAFTATAAAVLATEGKLDFDAPVIEYLPAFRLNDRYATENLTLRDFLSHRSGLPRHEYAWYGTGFSREQLLKNLKDLPLSARSATASVQQLQLPDRRRGHRGGQRREVRGLPEGEAAQAPGHGAQRDVPGGHAHGGQRRPAL